jgi:hypothetical protein
MTVYTRLRAFGDAARLSRKCQPVLRLLLFMALLFPGNAWAVDYAKCNAINLAYARLRTQMMDATREAGGNEYARRSLQRELEDMARNRVYAAEDSERRIRGLRGEDSMTIDVEQRIVDAYRKSREDTIAIERRFSDEEELPKLQAKAAAPYAKKISSLMSSYKKAGCP